MIDLVLGKYLHSQPRPKHQQRDPHTHRENRLHTLPVIFSSRDHISVPPLSWNNRSIWFFIVDPKPPDEEAESDEGEEASQVEVDFGDVVAAHDLTPLRIDELFG